MHTASDSEFAMSEFGDVEDSGLLIVVGMIYSLFMLLVVVVGGDAVVIRGAHIHETGMFARAASIYSHTSSPTLAITGGGAIRVLQGFEFDVGIGVGRKSPDSVDLFLHAWERDGVVLVGFGDCVLCPINDYPAHV